MNIKWTLRTKLLFFALVTSTLPLLLLLTFINFQIRTETRHYMEENLQANLYLARGIIEQRGDGLQGNAGGLAEMISAFNLIDADRGLAQAGRRGRTADRGDGGPVISFLNTLLNTWKVDFLMVTDAQGRVRFRAHKPEATEDDFRQHLLVNRALEGKPATGLIRETSERLAREGLEVKAAIKPRDNAGGSGAVPTRSGGLCLEAAVPILGEDKEVLGVVLMGELLNNDVALVDEIKGLLFGNRGEAGAVSILMDNTIVATNLFAGEERALGASGRGDAQGGENWFGHYYVSAYETLKDPRGTPVGKLQVLVQEHAFQQPENQFRVRVLQATVLAIFIFFGVAVWASRRVTRPILEITHASNRVSLGELDTAVQAASGDEMEVLAEAVERMRLSLRAALARLKKV